MDEHYPWSSGKQRYRAPALDKKERPWGPYYLGAYDLGDVRDHRALFVRKTSRDVDANVFALLPVDDFAQIPALYWPEGGGLSRPKPQAYASASGGDEDGCVRVAESIHCPPVHNLGADVHEAARLVGEL